MALANADRIKDTTTTTGTGTFTLSDSAPTGFQTFGDGVGDGNTCWYCAQGGAEWEVGIGTYTASGTTLARTQVLASSNSGSAVSFSAGTKDVFVTLPADLLTTGTYTPLRGAIAGIDFAFDITVYECLFSRVGNLVSVSGKTTLAAVSADTFVSFEISLPIDTSHTSASTRLFGSGSFTDGTNSGGVAIFGDQFTDGSNLGATLELNVGDASSGVDVYWQLTYTLDT